MTYPIKLYAIVNRDQMGGSHLAFDTPGRAANVALDCDGKPEVVELIEVRRCGTCERRRVEMDYNEMSEQTVSWFECSLSDDGYIDERVNDGTGFCHRHKEKTDG
jgi:hypothetical protein